MRSIKILIISVLILILSIQIVTGYDSLGMFEQNQDIDLIQTCGSCTYNNISGIKKPDGTNILLNTGMTKTGTFYNYNLSGVNTNQVGDYLVNGFGDLGGTLTIWTYTFTITKDGMTPAGDNLTIFIYILFIISMIGLLYTSLLSIVKIVTANQTIYDVLISWAFYILMIIVIYLSENYIPRTFIEDLANPILTVTTFTNGLLPMISLVITMFIKSTQKKRPLTVEELTGQRIMKYG